MCEVRVGELGTSKVEAAEVKTFAFVDAGA